MLRLVAIILAASVCSTALADQNDGLPRVAIVWFSTPVNAKPYDEAFRAGLRELGYVEGKNILILRRYANGETRLLPNLLREVLALQISLIVVTPTGVHAAVEATQTVPIVCFTMDELERGYIATLGHPTGNLTGLATQGAEIHLKLLELAHELLPNLKRLAYIFDANFPERTTEAKKITAAASEMGVSLQSYGVRDLGDIKVALGKIKRDQPQTVLVPSSPLLVLQRELIMNELARRVPVISEGRSMAEAGPLLTYGANFFEQYSRGAAYVDKILKGAKPSDLPIEQPTKFDLIVNLKTARALGIEVPQSILLRATETVR